MGFNLRQLRKASKMTQSELAQAISVDIKTIGNWERGETFPDADQLWSCAEALNCSPNDILGWYESHPCEIVLEDSFEKELVTCYRDSTVQRKAAILQTARDAAGMSKETAEPAISKPERREVM